jgi:hypothetical protein
MAAVHFTGPSQKDLLAAAAVAVAEASGAPSQGLLWVRLHLIVGLGIVGVAAGGAILSQHADDAVALNRVLHTVLYALLAAGCACSIALLHARSWCCRRPKQDPQALIDHEPVLPVAVDSDAAWDLRRLPKEVRDSILKVRTLLSPQQQAIVQGAVDDAIAAELDSLFMPWEVPDGTLPRVPEDLHRPNHNSQIQLAMQESSA